MPPYYTMSKRDYHERSTLTSTFHAFPSCACASCCFVPTAKKKFTSLSSLKSIIAYFSLFSTIKDRADKTSWRSMLCACVSETIKVACCVHVCPSQWRSMLCSPSHLGGQTDNMHWGYLVLTARYSLLWFSLGCSPDWQQLVFNRVLLCTVMHICASRVKQSLVSKKSVGEKKKKKK